MDEDTDNDDHDTAGSSRVNSRDDMFDGNEDDTMMI